MQFFGIIVISDISIAKVSAIKHWWQLSTAMSKKYKYHIILYYIIVILLLQISRNSVSATTMLVWPQE